MASSSKETSRPPSVKWAQDKNHIYLTVEASDVAKPEIDIQSNKVSFEGFSNTCKVNYKFELELFKEIDPENSHCSPAALSTRCWTLKLKKKDEGEAFWERLTKDKSKVHWLKIDWSRWKDEDTVSDELPNFANYDDDYTPPEWDGEEESDESIGDDESDEEGTDKKKEENQTPLKEEASKEVSQAEGDHV